VSYSFNIPKTAVAEAPAALKAAAEAATAGFGDDDFGVGADQKGAAKEAVEVAETALDDGYFDSASGGVTVSISGHGRKNAGAGSAAPTMNISIIGYDL
jgi:hypothetical protein